MANSIPNVDTIIRKSIVCRNTNTGSDINTSTATELPITGVVDPGYDTEVFGVTGNRVVCKIAGKIRIECHVYHRSPQYNNIHVMLFVAVNGNLRSINGGGGYISRREDHLRSMATVIDEFSVAADDEVSIYTQREAGFGLTRMEIAQGSILTVEYPDGVG